jgi:hypothetical protein
MDGSESDGSNTDSSSSSAVKHILTACELRCFGLRLVNFADDRISQAKHASQRQKFVDDAISQHTRQFHQLLQYLLQVV